MSKRPTTVKERMIVMETKLEIIASKFDEQCSNNKENFNKLFDKIDNLSHRLDVELPKTYVKQTTFEEKVKELRKYDKQQDEKVSGILKWLGNNWSNLLIFLGLILFAMKEKGLI